MPSPSLRTGDILSGEASSGPGSLDSAPPAGLVTIWNVATGEILRTLEGPGGVVRAVAMAPDGKTFASGNFGPAEVRLWDIATGKLIWAIKAGKLEVLSLTFWPDGKTLIYCDDDGVFEIDVQAGKIARTISRTTTSPIRKARE